MFQCWRDMNFQKFDDFLKSKITEDVNRSALDYDRKLAQFNSRFQDPKQALEVLRAAGYPNVASFLSDPNDRKWSRLKMPGANNWRH